MLSLFPAFVSAAAPMFAETGSLPTHIFPCQLRISHSPTAQFSVSPTKRGSVDYWYKLCPIGTQDTNNMQLLFGKIVWTYPRLADEDIQQIHGVIEVLLS